MMIRRVDGRDRPVGLVKRARALASGANFRVVHILILNRHGELLLQQIADHHERHPGWWGSSVAGYVAHDESYRDAAKRKLREELGVAGIPTFLGKLRMHDGGSQKFVGVFRLLWDGPIAPNPADFRALCFVPFEHIGAWQRRSGARLTPTLLEVLRYVREHGDRQAS